MNKLEIILGIVLVLQMWPLVKVNMFLSFASNDHGAPWKRHVPTLPPLSRKVRAIIYNFPKDDAAKALRELDFPYTVITLRPDLVICGEFNSPEEVRSMIPGDLRYRTMREG